MLLEERARALVPGGPARVLDLGCGVGGTLFHLAAAFPASRLVGVTISERQLTIARRIAERRGLSGRCRFEREDFLTMRLDLEADVALAVESFVHAPDGRAFFRSVAAHLAPGGHLLLVDDFLAREESTMDDWERAVVETFRRGWHAPGVCTVEACLEAARGAGLERVAYAPGEVHRRGVPDTGAMPGGGSAGGGPFAGEGQGAEDLTPLIRLGRPRDRAIALLAPLFRRLGLARIPFFGNMIGGNALQAGLGGGLLRYRLLVLRKGAPG